MLGRMVEPSLGEMLLMLTSGWPGFVIYWLLFMAVALLEAVRPSGRPQADVGDRILVNFGLGLLVAVIQMLPSFSAYGAALISEQFRFGLLQSLDLPYWLACLGGFLLLDLGGYAFHRASHQVPLLWRLHRVHHTDRVLDVSTTLRSHPLSTVLYIGYDMALVLLLGIEPAAVLIYAMCKMATMWLSHADVKASPRLSSIVSTLVVTPAYHHQHHHADPVFTDSNYGEVLTIWDRLFGTRSRPDNNAIRYGLGDAYDAQATSLWSQLKLPFKNPVSEPNPRAPSVPHSADR